MKTEYAEAVKILGLLAVEEKNWSAARSRLPELFEAAAKAEASLVGLETRARELKNSIARLEAAERDHQQAQDKARDDMEQAARASALLMDTKVGLEKEVADYRAVHRAQIDQEIAAKEEKLAAIEHELKATRARLGL